MAVRGLLLPTDSSRWLPDTLRHLNIQHQRTPLRDPLHLAHPKSPERPIPPRRKRLLQPGQRRKRLLQPRQRRSSDCIRQSNAPFRRPFGRPQLGSFLPSQNQGTGRWFLLLRCPLHLLQRRLLQLLPHCPRTGIITPLPYKGRPFLVPNLTPPPASSPPPPKAASSLPLPESVAPPLDQAAGGAPVGPTIDPELASFIQQAIQKGV